MDTKAKFRSTTPFNDILQFMSKQGLTIVALGAMMLAIGIILGAIVCTVKSVVGGVMILLTLVVVGLAIIYHGMLGISKNLSKNRTLGKAEYKEITVTADSITEEQGADGYHHKVTTAFSYVDRIIKTKGQYQIFLSGGLLLLAKERDMLEGDITELNCLFSTVFGEKFVDIDSRRAMKSIAASTTSVDGNSSDSDTTVSCDNTSSENNANCDSNDSISNDTSASENKSAQ